MLVCLMFEISGRAIVFLSSVENLPGDCSVITETISQDRKWTLKNIELRWGISLATSRLMKIINNRSSQCVLLATLQPNNTSCDEKGSFREFYLRQRYSFFLCSIISFLESVLFIVFFYTNSPIHRYSFLHVTPITYLRLSSDNISSLVKIEFINTIDLLRDGQLRLRSGAELVTEMSGAGEESERPSFPRSRNSSIFSFTHSGKNRKYSRHLWFITVITVHFCFRHAV